MIVPRALLTLARAAVLVGAVASARGASADQTAPKQITCLEKIPQGAKRPTVEERFPGEVVAGYEATLELEIRHGKGETPLASGFRLSSGSDVEKALKTAGFLVADPDAGARFEIETESDGDRALTKARIPIVVAPNQSGTRSLILPEMPIPISRANGETMTICTRVHLVTVTDPTAGEEDPKPHPNAPARPQIEPWPLMKWILLGILLALIVLAITIQWIRRQLALAAPSPEATRGLPWDEALLELAALRASPLYDDRAGAGPIRAELFDRTSDTVRKYLGARYGFEGLGFDGLETTTGEMMTLLARVRPGVPRIDLVRRFLDECDLVKFAKVDPSIADCDEALRRAETIVRVTTPLASNAAAEPAGTSPTGQPPPPEVPPPYAGGPP